MPEEATEVQDKQALYYRRFHKRLREQLKTLITPELIEEHRQDPLGHHSDALSRVLNYFRRGELPDKYIIHRMKPQEERFRVMALSGNRNMSPRVVDERTYDDINEAHHAVFLLRVNDLLES